MNTPRGDGPECTTIKFAVYFEEDCYTEAVKERLVKELTVMIRESALECYNVPLPINAPLPIDATTLLTKKTGLNVNGEPVWFCLLLYVDPAGNTPNRALVHIGRRQWVKWVRQQCASDLDAMSKRN